MTKKDYEALAAIVKQAQDKERSGLFSAWWLASNLAAMLSVSNPKFDRANWFKACGYPGAQ